MKTRVELRLSKIPDLKIIAEILKLSILNTSKLNEDVKIIRDGLDDKIVIITFDSPKGKQYDLADKIIKSYSHHLEEYSDISVFFETRNKKNNESYNNNITKNDIIELVEIFCESFDTKDWIMMENCLSDKLELDYPNFRGTPKYKSSAKKYVKEQKLGLERLKTKHETFGHSTSRYGEKIKCICDFEIRRYEIEGHEYLHSYGKYELWIKKINSELKIYSIKQEVERNEGNKNIHGAFKNKSKFKLISEAKEHKPV